MVLDLEASCTPQMRDREGREKSFLDHETDSGS